MADILELEVGEEEMEFLRSPGAGEEPVGEGTITCPSPQCFTTCPTRSRLRKHWWEVHKPFCYFWVCPLCGNHFQGAVKLRRHLAGRHKKEKGEVARMVASATALPKPNPGFRDPKGMTLQGSFTNPFMGGAAAEVVKSNEVPSPDLLPCPSPADTLLAIAEGTEPPVSSPTLPPLPEKAEDLRAYLNAIQRIVGEFSVVSQLAQDRLDEMIGSPGH